MTAYEFGKRIALSLMIAAVLMLAIGFFFAPQLNAAEIVEAASTDTHAQSICWAAAIAFGFGALGAGYAISRVGAAAMGAIAERPEIATNALIFIALAEGLVVFGFITALMILGKV